MSYLQINYVQAHAKLRAQEMGFPEFMALINRVYEFGHTRGVVHGIGKCEKVLAVCKDALEHCEGAVDELHGYPITYDMLIEALMRVDEILPEAK